MLRYSEVTQRIQPLEEQKNYLEKKQQTSITRLKECSSKLNELTASIEQLKASFSRTTGEAQELKAVLELTQGQMKKASLMLTKLSGEQERWSIENNAIV